MECNLSPQDAAYWVNKNKFSTIASILLAWSKVHYQPVVTEFDEIMNSVIWGNSLIQKKNKPIFEKRLINSNIEKIMDITHPFAKRFLMYTELVDQFGVVFDKLYYLTILASIPRYWRTTIRSNSFETALDMDQKIDRYPTQATAKRIYWDIIKREIQPLLHLKTIWEKELNTQILEKD